MEVDDPGNETGNGSNPAPATEDCHPLDLLCEDVWLEVFRYLDPCPRDLLNVGATCTYFELLFETYKLGKRGAGKQACQVEEVLPLVFKCLARQDALNMRLACKRIGETVDKILDNADRVSPYQSLGLFPKLSPPVPLESYEWGNILVRFRFASVHLNTIVQMQEFQKYLEGPRLRKTGGIAGKRISIEGPMDQAERAIFIANNPGLANAIEVSDQDTFLRRTLEFFTACQQESFYWVNVKIHQDFLPIETYDYFRKLVQTLPHLRRLDVHDEASFHGAAHLEGQLLQLDNFVKNNHPLPASPNLERLIIMHFPMPPPFLRQIADVYGAQLKKLGLKLTYNSLFTERPVNNEGLPQYEFPILDELKVTMRSEYLPLIMSFKAPQLKTLLIAIDGPTIGSRPAEPILELGEVINSFPSVTCLHLRLYRSLPEPVNSWWDILLGRQHQNQQHQNVKELVITRTSRQLQLRFFIQLFPNLEKLLVRDINLERQNDQYLNLLMNGHLQRSSIWREAPLLKMVRFTVVFQHPTTREPQIYLCTRPRGV